MPVYLHPAKLIFHHLNKARHVIRGEHGPRADSQRTLIRYGSWLFPVGCLLLLSISINVITDELPIIITHLLWEPLGIFIIIELFIICKEQRENSICARPFLSQEGQNQKLFGWEMHCLIPPWNSGGLRNPVKTYFGRSYELRFYLFTVLPVHVFEWGGVTNTSRTGKKQA